MDTVELLTKFADPEVIKTLAISDRLMAGLVTTILGMGITFIALVVLQFVIGLMAKLSHVKEEPAKVEEPEKSQVEEAVSLAAAEQDEELVAAITTAIAMQLSISVSKIVIRNIEKIEESSNTWQKAGIAEHMNNTL